MVAFKDCVERVDPSGAKHVDRAQLGDFDIGVLAHHLVISRADRGAPASPPGAVDQRQSVYRDRIATQEPAFERLDRTRRSRLLLIVLAAIAACPMATPI